MKILYVIQCANLGGMEQVTLRRMVGLRDRGHQCQLVSLNPIGDLGSLLKRERICARGLDYQGQAGIRSLASMYRAFRSEPADAVVMVGHNVAAMLALGSFCKQRRILSMHYHHAGVKPEWQWKLIYRIAARRFSHITFASDFIRKEAEAIYPPIVPKSLTLRDPMPLPPPPTQADRLAARRALGIPEGAPVVGNAGWLIERKRFDVFLRVARSVSGHIDDAVFLIAGDGDKRDSLHKLALELGISQRVRWLGWQTDLTSFYRSLDVLLFNSDWDAFPRTPLESIAAGVPVVASLLNGGLNELLGHEDYGCVTDTHDIEWLARRTVSLLRSRGERARVVAAGQQRILSFCSPERDLDQICQMLGSERQGAIAASVLS